MNTESHPGAIWNKGRRLKPLGTFEARERQSRRDLRKSMRQTMAEMQAEQEFQLERFKMIFRPIEIEVDEPAAPGAIAPRRVN